MTSRKHTGGGCCVFSFLVLTALLGCGSGNTPGPDARTDDPSTLDAADRALTDGPTTPGTSDGDESGPGITIARSSIQRVADPQVPEADSATLASDNAAFAFAAYKQLAAGAGNLVFSPVSISIAMAMAYSGAVGTTATEMANALHFSLPPAQLHPAFNALDQALASRGQGALGADGQPMRLNIVNSVWAQRGYQFKQPYLDTLAANYGAGVNLLDFAGAPEPSRVAINDWVAGQTNNKILDLLPRHSVDTFTRLVLTNAVYFNAAWMYPFNSIITLNGAFTLLDGKQVYVKFMNQVYGSLPAVRAANYVAASLPYADKRLSLLLVVPDVGQFSQVESALDAPALAALVGSLVSQPTCVNLPRFKVETNTSLVEILKKLGMTSAFDPYGAADFSAMDGTRDLFITNILHKAFMNVGEKGTEAAAATAVIYGVDGGVSAPPPELPVNADHPFLYFLRDEPTGAILFMGRILEPIQS